ncbi:MAG: TonB-dependent receptor [Longimicrobiales bacterium]
MADVAILLIVFRSGEDTMSVNRYSRIALLFGTQLVLGSVPLFGQAAEPPHGAVTGTVVDAGSGAPVVAADVALVSLHHRELTHADGRFLLSDVEPGTYTLTVERLGYRSSSVEVVIRPDTTVTVRIALDVAAIDVGSVVALGALSARSRDDVLSPVSTLSGAELDRQTSQTLGEMLDGQPGLASTSLGPTTARPIIRGLGGNRILMLEDGHRTGDMSSTSSDHAVTIEPLTARQVEVVRGPMSLMYGSSALGGVVNVVRDEIPTSRPDRTHGALMIQGASVNEGFVGAGYASTALGQFSVRAEGTARRFGDLSTPIGDLINTGGATYDAAVGAGLTDEHLHAGASYRFYANDYGIPGGFVGGHATGVDISMRRHALRGEAALHREGEWISSVDIEGGFTRYDHEELEPSGNVGTRFDQDMFQGQAVARHAPRGVFREGAFGVTGLYRDITTGGTLRTPSTWDYSLAAFMIEEVGSDELRVQFGLRYDRAQFTPRDTTSFVTAGGERIPVRTRTFGSFSGSAGVLWRATESVRLGASLSRAYRTPDFNELFSNGPHLAANSFDVGDPSLGQETGLGFDVFARVTTDQVRAEVAAYRNVLSDYVFPSSRGRAELGAQGGRPRFQYTNEDARFTGVEGEVQASLGPLVVLEGSASLVRAIFTSDRAQIPVFEGVDTTFIDASTHPPLIPPAQGRVGLRLDRPGQFAGVGLKLVAEQDRVGDFETPTAGYGLVDASAGVRLVRGGVLHTVTLRIDNALNREYRDHLSRVKDIMPGPGRSVSLLYRLVF